MGFAGAEVEDDDAAVEEEAEADSEWCPPMLEPRLLGLMPEPTKGDELLAANAEKPDLALDDPEEEGTALKGEDLELNAEKVGCVRVGASASLAGADVVLSLAAEGEGAAAALSSSGLLSISGLAALSSCVLSWCTFSRM